MNPSVHSVVPVPDILERAFAPLHKLALGVAVGVTAGLVVLVVTVFHVVAQPVGGPPLYLLVNYFYGYSVTWTGALVGFWWGMVAGFSAGWFTAFLRNLALAIWIFVVRTKAELARNSDLLDHI